MLTWAIAYVLTMVPAADAALPPPIIGRPVDFSGAIGGPFVVQWVASPTEIMTEDAVTLSLRITGSGNLNELPRPAIGKLEPFKPFAVEDLDDRFVPGDPPRREFRYRARPRSAAAKEIPRFKFVYFNPRIVPAARGYQTTYADAVPLTVKPRKLAAPTGLAAEAPAWMLEPPASDELFGAPRTFSQQWLDWLRESLRVETDDAPADGEWVDVVLAIVVPALLVPPALCGAWLAVWRRWNPNAARIAAGRRSRAAAVTLRALDRAGADRAELVATALAGYLRDRAGLPATATTPAEIAAGLTTLGCPAPLVGETVALFHRCDAARFAPAAADAALAADARKTILDWEATSWAGPVC